MGAFKYTSLKPRYLLWRPYCCDKVPPPRVPFLALNKDKTDVRDR